MIYVVSFFLFLTSVAHAQGSGLIEKSLNEKDLQIKIEKYQVSENDFKTIFKNKIAFINMSYQSHTSPYPGFVTNSISCENKKPKIYETQSDIFFQKIYLKGPVSNESHFPGCQGATPHIGIAWARKSDQAFYYFIFTYKLKKKVSEDQIVKDYLRLQSKLNI